MPTREYIVQCLSKKLVYASVWNEVAGGVQVDALASVDYQGQTPGDAEWFIWLRESLPRVVARHPRGKPIKVILPNFPLLSLVIRIPKVREREMEGVVQAHIRQNLPYKLEDSTYCYQVIRTSALEHELLLTIVRKHWLETFLKVLVPMKLNIGTIEAPAWLIGEGHALRCGNKRCTLLINFDHKGTLVTISGDGAFYTRNFYVCTDTGTEEDFYKELLKEVELTLAYYQTHYDTKQVEAIGVTGTGTDLERARKFLEEALGLPAAVDNPTGCMEGAELLGAVVGSGYCGTTASLLPKRLAEIYKFRKLRMPMGAAAAVVILCLGWSANYLYERNATYREEAALVKVEVDRLRENKHRIEATQAEAEKYLKIIEVYGKCMDRPSEWSNFLASIQGCLDEAQNLWLDELRVIPGEDRAVAIAGRTVNGNGAHTVKRFLSELEKGNYVDEIRNLEVFPKDTSTEFQAVLSCSLTALRQ